MRLTIVGDDDQAIYRFRGSDIECFNQVRPYCDSQRINYRLEKLETNYRSTKNIVNFTQRFRTNSVLGDLSMSKKIVAPPETPDGRPVRLLRGPWEDLATCVATELRQLGAGSLPNGKELPPSAAVLMFSTSERSSKNWTAPATTLRRKLQELGVRTYNPRSKTAGASESPVAQLFGLLSYLVDPISYAPAGKNGRTIMVAASMDGVDKKRYALSKPPNFAINQAHLGFQKKFFKSGTGDIGRASSERALTCPDSSDRG
jgi:DNA helicase-2/ATP-dependent DNA helicase PcrA